jgi:two-component system heavy metal sensor histidine kinase CusS
MSWKTVAERSKSPATFVKTKISIANQLTAYFLLSAFLILFICMMMLYWGISQSLRTHSISYMSDEASIVVSVLNSGDMEGLSKKIVSSGQKEYAKLYVRLLDANNDPVIETPSMGHLIPVKAFHPPVPYNVPAKHDYEKMQIGAKDYIFETFLLDTVSGPRTVQMALDVTTLEHVLHDYVIKIVATLILGVVLSGMAGRYITSRGLRPIQAIADKTRQITASKLGERFSSERWPVELSSLAAALDTMMDRLQDSFERMRSYAANLAHELRTPIGILRGEAEVAIGRKRSCEEYEKVIESSLEEYQRLTRIIESLLFLAMADSREVELHFDSFNVNEEVHNLHDYYAEYAQSMAFMVLCDPDLTLWADPTLFRRAISNLIVNAIKYSPEGKLITVAAEKNAETLDVSVADEGRGIDSEHLERLYDRFYRVANGKTVNVKGSGLGLSIVRSIMILHGGSVSIDSAVGKGTKVTLSFPVSRR